MQSYIPQYFQTGLNPSWSLTLEYAFYASLPPLLGVLLFALRKRTAIRPLRLALLAPLILIVIGFIGRAFVPLAIEPPASPTRPSSNGGATTGSRCSPSAS